MTNLKFFKILVIKIRKNTLKNDFQKEGGNNMQEFKEILAKRIYELKQIIQKEEKRLKKIPEGSVQVTGTEKKVMFYINQEGKRRYARERDQKLVQQLCQKDYDQKILAKAQKELKELEKLYKNYDDKTYESVYEKIHPARQQLINSIWLPDDEYVKQWEAVKYTPKGFAPNDPEFYTDKGERVRSKSEILIANALKKHHIPYRYEYPYQFHPYEPIKHPDFTVLNVRTRKEYLWEHMGKMDGEGYRDYALNRIIDYEMNGIFPGDRLILTHETLNDPLNSKIIEKTIQHYLK